MTNAKTTKDEITVGLYSANSRNMGYYS